MGLVVMWVLAVAAGQPPGLSQVCAAGKCSDTFKAMMGKAEGGDADAENRVGEMLHFGQGAPRDFDAARQWYLRASDHGHPVAPNHLGRLYLNGEGVKKDVREACRWYAISGQRGDPSGRENARWCAARKPNAGEGSKPP